MKNILTTLLFLSFIGIHSTASATDVGEKAPDFSLKTLTGETVKLDDYVGKTPVYLVFWATWCSACLKEVAVIKEIHNTFGQRLPILAINIGIKDSVERAKAYQEKHKIPYPIAFDADNLVSQTFAVVATPTQFIVGRDGKVYYRGAKAPSITDINTNWKDLTQP